MKYSITKGTRDFSPIELYKRNFIIKIIEESFKIFGFYQLETPSFEKISTFHGKYGENGEKLIFKILNSGNSFIQGLSNFLKTSGKGNNEIKIKNYKNQSIIDFFSDKALRYDLTVPLVRYIAMHRNEIYFPFRRYQIQPVWRAEKPQKGRFREFYQCDADIISSYFSLWEEIELIKLCDHIFHQLNINVIIYINHIEILKSLADLSGIKKNLWKNFILSLDKWNKIGKDLVEKEMLKKGISLNSFKKITFFLDKENQLNFDEKKNFLINQLKSCKNHTWKNAIKDLDFIYNKIKKISLKKIRLKWNLSLARGINYYTHTIWEIVPIYYNKKKENIYNYSIGGGGRYNKLLNLFHIKKFFGTGVSFGLDRIYLIMEEQKLFQSIISKFYPSKILFINFGEQETLYSYKFINYLRSKGLSVQLYPYPIKISKQFKYANDNNIPFIIIIGKNEMINNKIKIKNTQKKTEKEYDHIHDLINDVF